MKPIGVVAIGRNEGPRLRECLQSVIGQVRAVVYVDSGSTDDSVTLARSLGVEVVLLDTSIRFSAARARNAGFERLRQIAPDVELVQFVDGDCALVPGWLNAAAQQLAARPDLAVVCGRRRERYPDASIYNAIINLEWNTPVGEAQACGGDALMRVAAVAAVQGFNPDLIAGEEPELCDRLRSHPAGGKVLRLPDDMTRHDAAITRFAQWWRRQVRSGYGGLDVEKRLRHGTRYFAREIWRARFWGLLWPAAVIVVAAATAFLWNWPMALGAAVVALALWPLQMLRLVRIARRLGLRGRAAWAYGLLAMLANWAQLQGQWNWL
ncbi:MAG: glycosyltransferase family A protein [Phycisphaerae bacterium]